MADDLSDEEWQRRAGRKSAMPPGWYAKEGDVDTVTFWDGFEWTDKVAPTRVTHDVKSLAQGVALGVVLGTFINGLLFWLVYFLVR